MRDTSANLPAAPPQSCGREAVNAGSDSYLAEDKEKFLLDPKFRLFSLREQQDAKTADFKLAPIREPCERRFPLGGAVGNL